MGRVFRPEYTRDIPPGTKIKGGKVVIVIKGQPRACKVRTIKGKRRAVVESEAWAIEWTDGNGKQRNKTVGKDKRLAVAALARAEEQAARVRHGLPDHASEQRDRGRVLTELFEEYGAVLSGRDTTEEYRETGRVRLDTTRKGCGWEVWSDINADDLTRFLGRLRDNEDLSPSTLNGYLRTVKAFCNWYSRKVDERSPVEGVARYAEDRDRRRSRRVLTDEELERLLVATEAAPRRYGTIVNGKDRAKLYLVAAYTGLRASELAKLAPSHFDLDATPPCVTVIGKGKRIETTPLPRHIADVLKEWMKPRKPNVRLWPGKWADQKRATQALGRDVKRAGLGAGVIFHGLRRKFVTDLFTAGTPPHVVRAMARHRDVKTTLENYAIHTQDDMVKAAESLPKRK